MHAARYCFFFGPLKKTRLFILMLIFSTLWFTTSWMSIWCIRKGDNWIHLYIYAYHRIFEYMLYSRNFGCFGEIRLNMVYFLPLQNFMLWKLSCPSCYTIRGQTLFVPLNPSPTAAWVIPYLTCTFLYWLLPQSLTHVQISSHSFLNLLQSGCNSLLYWLVTF